MSMRSLLPLLILLLSSCFSPSKPTLHLFTWSGFITPELIANFEKKYQCRVIIDVYDSNESMYAKLKLGSSRYDIIFPSNYYLDILKKQNMLGKLDAEKIPNLHLLDPDYLNREDKSYGVPFIISFSGIAYRKDRIDHPLPSWGIFSSTQYRGRMTMLNDARESLGAALKFLGYSVNTTDTEAVNRAGDLLIEWKQNLAKFENDQYKNGIANAEFLIVQSYSIDFMQVYQENENIAFLYPKEGAILSIDYMAIPKNAPNPSLAHTFINYLYEPENAALSMEHTNALIPVVSSYPLLPPSLQASPILFPSEKEKKKMELIKDLGEDSRTYYRVWERVKES